MEVQETSVFKTSKEHKKSAAEGGGLLRLFFRLLYRCFLDFQDKRYRSASYLMEHIFCEAQLCSEILIFKEKHVFGILINLCLGTSLLQQGCRRCGHDAQDDNDGKALAIGHHCRCQVAGGPPKGERSEGFYIKISIFIDFSRFSSIFIKIN